MSWKTIITYLLNGTPLGIKTVEFSNRLIVGISIPRKDFEDSIKRKELQRSGIYFLLGEDEWWKSMAYIWQATILWKRLTDHYRDTDKGFWNTVIAFTSKDWALNESDINYLEKELIIYAKQVGRYSITNWTSWNKWLIQEYREPDMIEFIEDIKTLLVSLWFHLLQELISKNEQKNSKSMYYLTSRGSSATWVYTEEGFVVLKWSKLSTWEITPSHVMNIVKRRQEIQDMGILIDAEFQRDCIFKTPTSACNIIAGWNQNGWQEWKTKDGKTLNEIERQII